MLDSLFLKSEGVEAKSVVKRRGRSPRRRTLTRRSLVTEVTTKTNFLQLTDEEDHLEEVDSEDRRGPVVVRRARPLSVSFAVILFQ